MTARSLLLGSLLAISMSCDDHVLGVVEVQTDYPCDWAGVQQFFDEGQCVVCHNGSTAFDMAALINSELTGDPGIDPLVVPGDAAASALWLAVTWEDATVDPMPPTASEPLPASQVEHIRCWIDDGAPL